MSGRMLASHFAHHFAGTVASELGPKNLSAVLEKAGLPTDWSDPACWDDLDETRAAEAYAGLQKAMRVYFGRGARGILVRVGGNLWKRLLADAPFTLKAQSRLLFGIPAETRRKPALELLAKRMAKLPGDVTVHTLDQDLLLVDQTSPGTLGQIEPEGICFVTLGLLRECLHWATGQEHDIEEISCRANGGSACEFKITIGR